MSFDKLGRALRSPGQALRYALAVARGHWIKRMFPLMGRRLTAGRNLRVYGRLWWKGPGRVILGDNVVIDKVVTPWTHHEDALIDIGDNSYLNGTRFGCQSRITVGAFAILGDASIADTDYHSTARNRHSPEAPIRVRPVRIEANVWIGSAAGILPGTTIGENSVVGYGAVCAGDYPADAIIVGNPARVVREIPD